MLHLQRTIRRSKPATTDIPDAGEYRGWKDCFVGRLIGSAVGKLALGPGRVHRRWQLCRRGPAGAREGVAKAASGWSELTAPY